MKLDLKATLGVALLVALMPGCNVKDIAGTGTSTSGASAAPLPASTRPAIAYAREDDPQRAELHASFQASVRGAAVRSAVLITPDGTSIELEAKAEPDRPGETLLSTEAEGSEEEIRQSFPGGGYGFEVTDPDQAVQSAVLVVSWRFPEFPRLVGPGEDEIRVDQPEPHLSWAGDPGPYEAWLEPEEGGARVPLLVDETGLGGAPVEPLPPAHRYRLHVTALSDPTRTVRFSSTTVAALSTSSDW